MDGLRHAPSICDEWVSIGTYGHLRGAVPPLIEVEGLPPDAAGLTLQDRRLSFASMQPGTGMLSVAENGVFEVTSETLAAIAPKLGPGAPPPFLSGPRPARSANTPLAAQAGRRDATALSARVP